MKVLYLSPIVATVKGMSDAKESVSDGGDVEDGARGEEVEGTNQGSYGQEM